MGRISQGGVFNTGSMTGEKTQPGTGRIAPGGVFNTGTSPADVIVTKPIPEQPGMLARGYGAVKEAITGEQRTTPEIEGLPEVAPKIYELAGPGKQQAALRTTAGFLLAADDQARAEIVQEQFPEAKVETNEQGVTVVTFPNGEKAVINKPGLSGQDIEGFLATVLKYIGPGKVASLGRGAAKKFGLGFAAEGLTELASQAAAKQLGQEEIRAMDVGLAAGLGGMTAAAGPLIKGFKEARQAKKLGALKEETKGIAGAITEAEEAAEATGIGLFQAQKTLAPSAAKKQMALSQLDGSSLKALEAIKKQDAEIGQAVEDTLAFIAPAKTIEEAPEMVVKAADKKLRALKKARTAAGKPLYEKALADKGLYDVPETRKLIDAGLEGIAEKSPLATKLNTIKGYVAPKEGAEGVSLSQLDRAYKDIGDMIETAKRQGKPALVRQLNEIKDTYIKEIEGITPEYQKAVKTWERMSKPIDKYLKSVPGKIAQLDVADQAKLDSVANSIFKPRVTDAQVLKAKAIIQKESPEAWDAITRRRFEDVLSKTEYDNPAKVYTALFSNKANKKQLYAALSPENKRRLRFLEVGVERAKRGRMAGPDTAFKIEDIKDIDKGAWSAIGGLFTPAESLKGFLKGLSVEQRRSALADVMFDTKWTADWKMLRKMQPKSRSAQNKLTGMLREAAKQYAKPTAQAIRAKTTED
jgi:hypothetical protein